MPELPQLEHRFPSAPASIISPSLAAILSFLIPGLGQALQGKPKQALTVFLTGLMLVACAWLGGRLGGPGAGVFFFMLFALPWWAIQSYHAYLSRTSDPPGIWRTLRIAWGRAHDIRYLGGLFLLTALTDFYIIIANPTYALTVFCAKLDGLLGLLAKAQSPTLHLLIGYGFLRLRSWSLFLYLVYAGFGLLNATANFACFGYGRVRFVFLITLAAFTAYVIWRRACFFPPGSPVKRQAL